MDRRCVNMVTSDWGAHRVMGLRTVLAPTENGGLVINRTWGCKIIHQPRNTTSVTEDHVAHTT